MTAWYPVALAADLEPGASAGTRLFGRELVLWRDDAGATHVWEDRCPHRGMRLSFGFVRGGRIACIYHGWQFDAAGQCAHIPSHPALKPPSTIRVAPEPSIERLGLIWTGVGPDLPPDEPAVPVRSLALRVPADRATAILQTAPPFLGVDAVLLHAAGPVITLATGPHRLLAAVQPVSGTESAIHLVLLGAPETYRGVAQAQVSKWAEALRRDAERAV